MSENLIPEGYKQTEVGVIPEDWDLLTINDVASFSGGSQPPRTTFRFSPREGYIRLIQIRDYKSSAFETFIPEVLARKKCSETDIMIGRYGPPIFQILKGLKGAYNVALIKTLPKEVIIKDYLYYFLKDEKLFALMDMLSQRSSGQTGVELPALKAYPIPLPSQKEQTAIANALSDVDGLLGELEKLIAKKQAIKTATMQQLLTGKTRLPQFAHHPDGTKKAQKQTELGPISEDWEVKSLKELSSYINDGTHHTPKYVPDGVPFYSVENVSANDFVNVKYISIQEHINLIKRCKPEKGDLLMTRIGTLGKTRVIDWDVNASIYVSLALIKLKSLVNPHYVYMYSKSRIFQQEVEKRSLVNATPQKINMSEIGEVPIPYPINKKEQTTIAKILSDMDSEIQTLQTRLTKTQQIKQGMMQQLLTGKVRLV